MKIRVKTIAFADPIVSAAEVATATFTNQAVTLRGDAITLIEGDPEESEDYSNEGDAPTDYNIIGAAKEFVGSFYNMTKTEIVALLGGSIVGEAPDEAAHIAASKTLLHKAIKITGHNGEELIIPNAKGYCLFSNDFSKDGTLKSPFKFKALQGAPDWDVDLIWQ